MIFTVRTILFRMPLIGLAAALAGGLVSCSSGETQAKGPAPSGVTVGVIKVGIKSLQRQLTVSSELVPFQQIDVYAKESGYVMKLDVDYGSRVKKDQVMAVLEIPELQAQLRQDDAATKSADEQVMHAEKELNRMEAAHQPLHLEADRLSTVSKSRPGLVAQQEVDDAQGKDLASEAQVEASKSQLATAQAQLVQAQAKTEHDQVLFDYSKITAPFAGVVTQRYANLGTLMQAGTSNSTQAIPLVQLSEDDVYRLVIPVPESYVRFIHIGDPVGVEIPSLGKTFPGKVKRFSVDVKEDTRTMHTEVDVENPNRVFYPGMYANATIALERNDHAISVPLQAVDHNGDSTTVFVVDASNKIESRPVTLGIQTDTDGEVVSGLKVGEMIVVSDRSNLKPGEMVKPQMSAVQQYKPEEQ